MKNHDSVKVLESYEAVSFEAANTIVKRIQAQPDLLLCAAGGSTPARTYELLIENHKKYPDLFQAIRILKLDEWGGLEMNDPGSCETQLRRQLIEPLGIMPDRYFSLNSQSDPPELECERMRKCLLEIGPIDLCVLGLGVNGHIGMNEPAAELQPYTHVAHLTEATLRHPMLQNSRSVPRYGMTVGMAEILASREILMLVNGKAKHEALQRFLEREISTQFPSSFLWLHSNWTLLCDRDSAGT